MGPFKAITEIFGSLDITGKLIVVLLVIISVYMWGLMVAKWYYLSQVDRGDRRIFKRLQEFRAQFTRDYLQVFRDFPDNSTLPLFKLYKVCCDHIFSSERVTEADIDSAEKLLDVNVAEEVIELEQGLDFLSVTATIAPFLGLLGTVWGIMISFRKMTQAGSTTISTVAPGISVALVTTVVGLVVAIPAAAGFYYFRGRVNRELVLMEKFSKELVVRLKRIVRKEEEA
jgi:biopolymer transport protein TolQ